MNARVSNASVVHRFVFNCSKILRWKACVIKHTCLSDLHQIGSVLYSILDPSFEERFDSEIEPTIAHCFGKVGGGHEKPEIALKTRNEMAFSCFRDAFCMKAFESILCFVSERF
jgi:hypothetical protein